MSDWSYWQLIRDAYAVVAPDLMRGIKHSPYDLGVDWKMSPIEKLVWSDIRFLGLPLYPQFPVGRYFIDFADPYRKIGIEVDSIQWHQDKEKDAKRQREIENMGWKIFRITSAMTKYSRQDFEGRCDDMDEVLIDEEGFINKSSEGFLISIYKNYSDCRETVTRR